MAALPASPARCCLFLVTAAALLRCGLAQPRHEPHVHQLTNTAGIYCNRLGSLKFINARLHVVVPVQLQRMQRLEHGVEAALRALNAAECDRAAESVKDARERIARAHRALIDLMSSSGASPADARATDDGSTFRSILGAVDQNEMIRYRNAIRTLKDNRTHAGALLDDDILVINWAQCSFDDALAQARLVEERSNGPDAGAEVTIQEAVRALRSSVFNLSRELEDVVESVLCGRTCGLRFPATTSDDIYASLVSHAGRIPERSRFPVRLRLQNVHRLVALSRQAAYATDDILVLVVVVPLVSAFRYDLYEPVPVPFRADAGYVSVTPSSAYVAVSEDRSKYCLLDDLDACVEVSREELACDKLHELSIAERPTCETTIIAQNSSSSSRYCSIHNVSERVHYWRPLGAHRWIFALSDRTALRVTCDSDHFEVALSGTGIVNLEPGCAGRSGDLLLVPVYRPGVGWTNASHCNCTGSHASPAAKPVDSNIKVDIEEVIEGSRYIASKIHDLATSDSIELDMLSIVLVCAGNVLLLWFLLWKLCRSLAANAS